MGLVTWIAPRVNQTVESVLVGTPINHLSDYMDQIIERDIALAMTAMLSYHDPKGMMKEIKRIKPKSKDKVLQLDDYREQNPGDIFATAMGL